MRGREAGQTLDRFRIAAALLVTAIHTSVLSGIWETGDFILTRIAARLAVPFFFLATGYFLQWKDSRAVGAFLKKIAVLYGGAVLLYLPLNFYTGYFRNNSWGQILRDILINGTFYHLWYLPAVLLGTGIAVLLVRRLGSRRALAVGGFLYLLGLGGDSYYGLISQIPAAEKLYQGVFQIAEYTRNGLFMAPVFLILGIRIRESGRRDRKENRDPAALVLFLFLLLAEGLLLHFFIPGRHDSMYLMLVPASGILFRILADRNKSGNRTLRSTAMMVYLIHPWMIVLVRGGAKFLHLESWLIMITPVFYFLVAGLSLGVSFLMVKTWNYYKKHNSTNVDKNKTKYDATSVEKIKKRAWTELDLQALRHNAGQLAQLLPKGCRLMAVVKDNAYGHGDLAVAQELNRAGIDSFAVAALSEGIRLREGGIRGDILILGYTDPDDAGLLREYDLIQTVVDTAYAKELNRRGIPVRVHIKVDSGMHRLGIEAEHREEIAELYRLEYLRAEGIYSHLSVSDSLKKEDMEFTKQQILRYYKTVELLRKQGICPGKRHIQASYGILNYPGLPAEYARAGIALYGLLSENGEIRTNPDLHPALSLKSRVALVRQVSKGEQIGYGRTYQAGRDRRIAVVTAGYGDGVPRALSGKGEVLVRGVRVPVVGRICMDQMEIDVSDVPGISPGDVVTIAGRDGEEEIRWEEIAEKCGTITNELVCRLGSRLERTILRPQRQEHPSEEETDWKKVSDRTPAAAS